MKVKSVRLENFRNVSLSEADLDSSGVWVFGRNAQGKTNLLEAVGLLNAARSFRTSQTLAMVKKGEKSARALYVIEHETLGEVQVLIELSSAGRKIFIDDEERRKFADFIGVFPALALCSEDIQLLRGAPQVRRKFVDMAISTVDREYFDVLKKYCAAVSQRNGLLKENSFDEDLFESFEAQIAQNGFRVCTLREKYLGEISACACAKYAVLARENGEGARINLKADAQISSPDQFAEILRAERPHDRILGATQSGPHRDDFKILIDSLDAKQYASEGQQRSLVLSLKLAFYELVKCKSLLTPVLLCDDILGELDPVRARAFWECVDPAAQVVASSTESSPNDSSRSGWAKIRVCGGAFERVS